VPLRAMCSGLRTGLIMGSRTAATHILCVCHRLKMIGVHASAVAAKVIDFEAIGNAVPEQDQRDAMGATCFSPLS
jgi:hypothetical protein